MILLYNYYYVFIIHVFLGRMIERKAGNKIVPQRQAYSPPVRRLVGVI